MRKNFVMVLLTLFMLSGAAALLSACNTTAGLGEDMSAAGHSITGAADNTKRRL